MNAHHYSMLEAVIQDWLDKACERADWPEVIIGDRTVECMATAARAVFEACEESQAYAEANGYMSSGAAQTK